MTRATPPRILAVDDESFIVRLVERLLAGNGCEVLTASGGREAVNIIE